MRTFGVRLAKACRAAEVIANKMADERHIEHVRYPGRLDHPDAGAVVDAVMPGSKGAMLSLVLAGGDYRVLQVLRRLEVRVEATSLGGGGDPGERAVQLVSLQHDSAAAPGRRHPAGSAPALGRVGGRRCADRRPPASDLDVRRLVAALLDTDEHSSYGGHPSWPVREGLRVGPSAPPVGP
jgi:hypothetical protein